MQRAGSLSKITTATITTAATGIAPDVDEPSELEKKSNGRQTTGLVVKYEGLI